MQYVIRTIERVVIWNASRISRMFSKINEMYVDKPTIVLRLLSDDTVVCQVWRLGSWGRSYRDIFLKSKAFISHSQ